MNLRYCIAGVLLFITKMSFAEPTTTAVETPSGAFNHVSYSLLGTYTDFNFDSTKGLNFNRFSGTSRLYSIGAGNIKINPKTTFGIALFQADTSVNARVVLNPGVPSKSKQSTRNNTLFVHMLRQMKSQLFIDLAGAYGLNKVNTETIILPETRFSQTGFATYRNNNWFTSLSGFYNKSYQRFTYNTNVRLLYSQIQTGRYLYDYPDGFPPQVVLGLTNKVLFSMENLEIAYKSQQQAIPFTPFINGGLIQVLYFKNSRPIVAVPINGISPQLNMDKGGYRLGTGLSYIKKQFTLRLEEQYYNSANSFRSFQTLLGLRYGF